MKNSEEKAISALLKNGWQYFWVVNTRGKFKLLSRKKRVLVKKVKRRNK